MVGLGLLLGVASGTVATPVKQESFWGSREIGAAIIGVVGILLGVIISALVEWWKEKRREDAERKRFAAGLLAEITAVLDRYKEVVGDPLMQWEEGKPLDIGGSIRVTNFFAVYDGNTDKLGLFQSDDAQKIVRAYTLAKAHVESLAVFRGGHRGFGATAGAIRRDGPGRSCVRNKLQHRTGGERWRHKTEEGIERCSRCYC